MLSNFHMHADLNNYKYMTMQSNFFLDTTGHSFTPKNDDFKRRFDFDQKNWNSKWPNLDIALIITHRIKITDVKSSILHIRVVY
jgi:hypothetical protein